MTITMTDLIKMPPTKLDEFYKNSPVGEIPDGQAKGTVIFIAEIPLEKVLSSVIRRLIWQGKVFDRDRGFLLNRITPFSLKLVKANVYRGESWLGDGESIILDYSKTSFVAQKVRDEIRKVTPGIYLGQAYWGKTRVLCFALEF